MILTSSLLYKIMIWFAQNTDTSTNTNTCMHVLKDTPFLVFCFGWFYLCTHWFRSEQWASQLWNVHAETSHWMRPPHQRTEPHQRIRKKSILRKSSLHLGSHKMSCLRNGVFQKVIDLSQCFNINSQGKKSLFTVLISDHGWLLPCPRWQLNSSQKC